MRGLLTFGKYTLLTVADWVDVRLRRSDERWQSECYYCGHRVETRAKNVATVKMCAHMAWQDDHPDDPEGIPDDLYGEVDHVFGPIPADDRMTTGGDDRGTTP